MRTGFRWLALAALLTPALTAEASAATVLTFQILKSGYFKPRTAPPEGVAVPLGETFTLILNVPGAKFSHVPPLPPAPGLTFNGSGTNPFAHTVNFFVTPARKGEIVVPAFNLRADDGHAFHVNVLRLHIN